MNHHANGDPATRPALPGQAQFVVIGGGIIGLSVAYHLTKLGHRDVVLLERKRLTCGTTWHAAGLVTQLRATENMARLAQYTAGLFHELERETGQATGFVQTGSLTVATTFERLEELRRGASMGRSFGLEVEMIDAGEAHRRVPLLDLEGVLGAAWIATDGKTNPVDTARAFEIGARAGGVRIFEDTEVLDFRIERGRVVGVVTDRGDLRCETVALCSGMWSRELGARAGVTIPLHAAEHFYIVTEPIAGVNATFPTVRDLDGCFYAKEDAGKLLVGAFETMGKPWGMEGIPRDFCFDQLPDDPDHLEPVLHNAAKRIPALGSAGVQLFFNGPESFTPDNRFLMGPTAEVDGLYVATGFNSCGIESSGGAGKVLAHWMSSGAPDADYWEIDIRRAMPYQRNSRFLRERTGEAVGLLYALHWPHKVASTARGVRRSPLHDRLAARGACFGEAAGWERVNWFDEQNAPSGRNASFGKDEWFRQSALEHRATREAVGVFDQTSFAHLLLQGRDALPVLQELSCNEVDVPVGRIVYTPWLNERGGMESDLTIARLASDQFLIVTAGAQRTRDFAWLRRHVARTDAAATITDLCSAYATIAVMGPLSRKLLGRLSPTDFSNEAFPFGQLREIEIGYGLALAFRITFVGELGFELHVPTEYATGVYDVLVESGEDLGLRNCGYLALDSLRTECGYRDWGHDISDEDSPLEAGLGFTIAWSKPSFIGRSAVLAQRGQPLARRLVHFALDDPAPLLFGAEPVLVDGQVAGHLKSAAYGHTLGRAVGLGYLRHDAGVTDPWLAEQRFEIDVAGTPYAARASLRPFFDPQRARVRS